jgi:hypothetical protein
MSITDYYTKGGENAFLNDQWSTLQTYVESLGFRVVRDHDGKQRSCECGIIAARVLAYLKKQEARFMEAVEHHETNFASSKYEGGIETLEGGNIALDMNDYFSIEKKEELALLGKNWMHDDGFLSDSSVEIVLDQFHGAVSLLWANAMESSRFAYIHAYDLFLKTLAKNIRKASLGDERPPHRVYSIVNTHDSRSTGHHWVAIVYSIRKKSQAELVVEQQAQALNVQEHLPDAAQAELAPGMARAEAAHETTSSEGSAPSLAAGSAFDVDCDMAQASCIFISLALVLLCFSGPGVPTSKRQVGCRSLRLRSIGISTCSQVRKFSKAVQYDRVVEDHRSFYAAQRALENQREFYPWR